MQENMSYVDKLLAEANMRKREIGEEINALEAERNIINSMINLFKTTKSELKTKKTEKKGSLAKLVEE